MPHAVVAVAAAYLSSRASSCAPGQQRIKQDVDATVAKRSLAYIANSDLEALAFVRQLADVPGDTDHSDGLRLSVRPLQAAALLPYWLSFRVASLVSRFAADDSHQSTREGQLWR
jgi:hypothetical protein